MSYGSESSRTRRRLQAEALASPWTDHTGVTTVALRHQVGQFNRDGYFTLERAFHQDTVAELIAALAFEIDLRDAAPDLALDEPPADVLRRFCCHPLLAGLARDFVGPEARVIADRAMVVRSGDPIEPFRQEPEPDPAGTSITCWIVLTDSTAGFGPLQVARGLQRYGRVPVARLAEGRPETAVDASQVLDVETDRGSVVVMSSLTPRRLGVNRSDRPALAYSIRYATDIDGAGEGTVGRRRLPVVRGGQLVGPS